MSAVLRHASAGYPEALTVAKKWGIIIPGLSESEIFDYKTLYRKSISFVKERTGIDLFSPLSSIDLQLL
jgi:hypothetical protein